MGGIRRATKRTILPGSFAGIFASSEPRPVTIVRGTHTGGLRAVVGIYLDQAVASPGQGVVDHDAMPWLMDTVGKRCEGIGARIRDQQSDAGDVIVVLAIGLFQIVVRPGPTPRQGIFPWLAIELPDVVLGGQAPRVLAV